MKNLFFTAFLFISTLSFAQTVSISLTPADQPRLTTEFSKLAWIDPSSTERVSIQDQPYSIVKMTYKYLSEKEAVSIVCSEMFIDGSPKGTEAECKVNFNYALNNLNQIEVQDGFMKDFVVASINNHDLAGILYKVIGNGSSSKVFFQSSEQKLFVHPATGNNFSARRLRIDCNGNPAYSWYGCQISAIKE